MEIERSGTVVRNVLRLASSVLRFGRALRTRGDTSGLARIFQTRTGGLINTGALARWTDVRKPNELFQQFSREGEKPLKRLKASYTAWHRAKAPVLMRICFNSLLTLPLCRAATFQETFAGDPLTHGWRGFGNTNLFFWNMTNQNLEVTWDSSQPNSYFQLPVGTILTRQDDFSFALDLRLDDVEGGANPDKPGTFELGFGFQNTVDAAKTNFFRGTGRNSPNLVEFDFFPAADSIQATVSPAFWSTDSSLSYNGAGDFTIMDLPLGVVMRITVIYTSSNQTMVTSITTNGIPVTAVHPVKISTNFTDFRVGTFAIESYSDAGQSGFDAGSLLAHGIVDNIAVTVPQPPVQNLREVYTNGASAVQFSSRTNWLYTLERSTDLQSWTNASLPTTGTGDTMLIPDTNVITTSANYRLRAERP